MRIDAATLALVLSVLALTGSAWDVSLDMEQAARIKRLETAMLSQCGSHSPNHHIEACAAMGLPLVYPPSIFSPKAEKQ